MSESPQVRVRFAPAPTGYLHLGGARTALFNWLFARHHNGTFVLRIEDTDLERSRAEVIDQVLESMRWLGLDWDEGPVAAEGPNKGDFGPYFQSQRRELHLDHARRLLAAGLAYECYMTVEELDKLREEAKREKRAFRYLGWHRDLTEEQVLEFRAEGRKPVLRLRLDPPDGDYVVNDLIRGETRFPPEQIDDFILVRSDGTPSFHLANVVDDALMKITHVIRGEDHLTNTVKHQVLFCALDFEPPQYAHLPMILGEDRSKLSKRHGAVSVVEYKEQGFLPEALVNSLALLGWSSPDGEERLSMDQLVERFTLDRVSKSGSIFDFAKTRHFNGLVIRELPADELAAMLRPYLDETQGIPEGKELDLVELVQKEIELLSDFPDAVRPILDEPSYPGDMFDEPAMSEFGAVLAQLATGFGAIEGAWARDEIKKAIKAAGKELGIKGKPLFFPLRAALTGVFHGPSLDGIAALLGKETTLARIQKLLEKVPGGES